MNIRGMLAGGLLVSVGVVGALVFSAPANGADSVFSIPDIVRRVFVPDDPKNAQSQGRIRVLTEGPAAGGWQFTGPDAYLDTNGYSIMITYAEPTCQLYVTTVPGPGNVNPPALKTVNGVDLRGVVFNNARRIKVTNGQPCLIGFRQFSPSRAGGGVMGNTAGDF